MKTNPHKTGGLARTCHPQDLIIVREGVQCGNCLALVIDKRQPTELPCQSKENPALTPTSRHHDGRPAEAASSPTGQSVTAAAST